ncbi:MAG: DUF4921 family protein, partial [Bifidobacteriaceae bacterium]|nr:DUF4921 family protein [Bifidobacteriaceae bacterium]
MREPEYVDVLADGTVKQLNPFTGTEVWTVAGRGRRPLGLGERRAEALDPGREGAYCVFCPGRQSDTPPEKARLVMPPDPADLGQPWPVRLLTAAEDLERTTAEFRRIPNLFEILSFDYWQANYGYELPADLARAAQAYVASPAGRAHVDKVLTARLTAMGQPPARPLTTEQLVEAAGAFLASGHDVIVARRHFIDHALDDSQL